jgi:DNA-binding transcriptional regulator YdaS (Cro superfamily)
MFMALKEIDPRTRLQAVVGRYPTQQDAAAELGISPSYLSDMLAGKRNISDRILAWIGLRATVVQSADPKPSKGIA